MKIYVAMGETAIRDSFFTPKALEKVRRLGEVKLYNRPQLSCSKEELIEEIGALPESTRRYWSMPAP